MDNVENTSEAVETAADQESSLETSSDESLETSSTAAETTVPYEDSIQYDVNYNFGYMSIWLGAIFGVLLVIAFMKGFGND